VAVVVAERVVGRHIPAERVFARRVAVSIVQGV
jgi:hypothetical protein